MVFFKNYFHPNQQVPTTSGSTAIFFNTQEHTFPNNLNNTLQRTGTHFLIFKALDKHK